MKEWKDYFDKQVLKEGQELQERNLVSAIFQTSTGYIATIEDIPQQQVELHIQDQTLESMQCSCSKAKQGKSCKHEAALLYELAKRTNSQAIPQLSQLQTSLTKVTKQQLIEWMMSVCHQDASLAQEVMRMVQPKPKVKPKKPVLPTLKRGVQRIIERYKIDYIYIEDGIYSFMNALVDHLSKQVHQLEQEEDYMTALELILYVAYEMHTRDFSEYGDACYGLEDEILSYWNDVVRNANKEHLPEIKQWFQRYYNKSTPISFYHASVKNVLEHIN